MRTKLVHVAIADDNEIYRYVAKNKIAETKDFITIIEAGNGVQLIEQLEQSAILPDICILDLSMPVMDGYETIKIVSKKWPSIKTLVISQYCQSYAIESMISLGARGFISKEEMLHCLAVALLAMVENGHYFSDMAAYELYKKAQENTLKLHKLTNAEKQVLALLCLDIQYDEIAAKMFKSKRTIEKHKQNISRKVGIQSREGLILFAIKNEFTVLG